MAHRMLLSSAGVAACAILLLGACRSSGSVPASGSQSLTAEEPEPAVSIVDSSVVLSACADAKTMNQRAAREAIRKLVDPCAAVPGGKAHFAATMLPDGRIQLADPSGDPAEGIVPTCVLQNKLTHRVALRQPCKFDVQLVERPAPASSSPTP